MDNPRIAPEGLLLSLSRPTCSGSPAARRFRFFTELYPNRCVVAGFLPPSDFAVHVCADKALRKRRAQKQMIDPEPRIAPPGVSEIVPECVDPLVRVEFAKRIEPALTNEPTKGL